MFSFDLDKINELSKRICDDFAAGFPPEMQAENTPRSSKKLISALDAIDQKIAGFLATKPRIGVFRKAKCANEVKWGLKDKGYREEIVDSVVRKVVFGLSQKIPK